MVPKPLGSMLALLPQYPPSVVFAAALNLALNRILPREVLQPLLGKRVCLRITDAGIEVTFTLTGNGFNACLPGRAGPCHQRHRPRLPDAGAAPGRPRQPVLHPAPADGRRYRPGSLGEEHARWPRTAALRSLHAVAAPGALRPPIPPVAVIPFSASSGGRGIRLDDPQSDVYLAFTHKILCVKGLEARGRGG